MRSKEERIAILHKAKALLAEGHGIDETARLVQVSKAVLYDWARKYEIPFSAATERITASKKLLLKEQELPIENLPTMHTFHFPAQQDATPRQAEEPSKENETPMVLLVGKGEQINKALEWLSQLYSK